MSTVLPSNGSSQRLIEVTDVWKSFGEVTALRGASLWADRGELTAIVGDNGAGKSTLIKCISGVFRPDQGTIQLNGTPVSYQSPEQARRSGVETVYQDLALVDDLSVYENVFLDRELTRGLGPVRFLARQAMQQETERLFESLNVTLPSIAGRIRGLSGGQRQAVAIARGVMWGQELVIMDEPTAALGVRETAKVEALIRDLIARGLGLIVISHNLDQVMRLSARVWVMRGGRVVGGLRTAEASNELLVSMITGLADEALSAAPSAGSGIGDM